MQSCITLYRVISDKDKQVPKLRLISASLFTAILWTEVGSSKKCLH